MKAFSLLNFNHETTSYPNFFSLLQEFGQDNDNTLNKRPRTSHCYDTEASVTSPFKDTILPSNTIGLTAAPSSIVMISHGSEQKCQTLQRTNSVWSNQTLSSTRSSVGSNQSSGIVKELLEGQLRGNVRALSEGGNVKALSEGRNLSTAIVEESTKKMEIVDTLFSNDRRYRRYTRDEIEMATDSFSEYS